MARAAVTQATITRTVKAVQAVGLPVVRVEVTPDGKVTVISDEKETAKSVVNEWDDHD